MWTRPVLFVRDHMQGRQVTEEVGPISWQQQYPECHGAWRCDIRDAVKEQARGSVLCYCKSALYFSRLFCMYVYKGRIPLTTETYGSNMLQRALQNCRLQTDGWGCFCFFTCSLSSASWAESCATSVTVVSSFSCSERISFCSLSPSLLTRDMARIRGNQSRFFSCERENIDVKSNINQVKRVERLLKPSHRIILNYLICSLNSQTYYKIQ